MRNKNLNNLNRSIDEKFLAKHTETRSRTNYKHLGDLDLLEGEVTEKIREKRNAS